MAETLITSFKYTAIMDSNGEPWRFPGEEVNNRILDACITFKDLM